LTRRATWQAPSTSKYDGLLLLRLQFELFRQFFSAKVDFDRTRYFSDKEIQKRNIEKLKTIEIDKMKFSQLEKERERSVKAKEIAQCVAFLKFFVFISFSKKIQFGFKL
jgi:hypothetical protein